MKLAPQPIVRQQQDPGAFAAALVANPFIIWPHRGGMNTSPENSVQAFQRMALEQPGFAGTADTDVYVLADGTAVVMHDATIDRTSSGTGNVTSFLTAASWQAQVLDAQTWLGPGYANEALPLLSAVLAAYPTAYWSIEAKNAGAGAAITTAMQAAGIPGARGLVWGGLTEVVAPLAAGYAAGVVAGDLAASGFVFTDLVAAGIRHICFTTINANTQGAVISARAAGLKVYRYSLQRRTELAAAAALGCDGIFAEEPQYLGAKAPLASVSNWSATNKWMPGMLFGGSDRGTLSGGRWGWFGAPVQTYYGSLMGWACPLANAQGSYTITFDFNMAAAANNGRWGHICVGRTTDAYFNNGVADTDPCYEILWRQNGSMEFYRRDAGAAAVQVAILATGTFTLGATYTMVLTVTPTTVTLTRQDNGLNVSYAHAGIRGGYFHLGQNGCTISYGTVSIT